ncbi:amino acid adenylation domain-containing protein [Nocardiopsis sediminis]|uniref:Amino acid adenylation domain-containing protein n=1 Tax=Nocardiopsis sediminis TaxID=1778267 RepID=A0ABV8FHC0_9ACTN
MPYPDDPPAQSPPPVAGAGATATPYPRESCLHDLFDAQARARPEAVAAVHGGRRMTYDDLRMRSDALAERLAGAGVHRGECVGVFGTRSLDALVAFLGILKAGAAYVPLDATSPPARLQAMAEDAGVQVAVVLPGHTCRIRRLRTRIDLAAVPLRPTGAPRPGTGVTAGECAYTMFTSGTSGRPKPVAIPHRGVVRLAVSDPRLRPPGPGDRVLHAYGLSSDASTIEIWSGLLGGARLVLIDREDLLSPAALEARLCEHAVTVAYLTTSVFHQVAKARPAALSGLRFVSAGGEALDPGLARAVRDACPGAMVVNFYGPTENTVVSTAHIVEDVPPGATALPIGRPIANSTCQVWRADGTPASPGEEGDLLVGGDGLALGYPGDPRLTAERFIEDPRRPGRRLYRTGDRAAWRADGELDFRGRTDRQVKLRGHRIELDEVEARLRAHPGVGEAAVDLVREAGRADTLIAYLTPAVPGRAVPVDALRADLAGWLPAQAVPSRFVEMPHFPVGRAGKVDRAELAARAHAQSPAEAPPPGTAAAGGPAGRIAALWETVLHRRPAPGDDFFAIGGDSLLAAEVVTRTLAAEGIDARHGTELVRCLLDSPTLAGYAEAVERVRTTGSGDEEAAVDWADEARLGFALPAQRSGPGARWDRPRDVLLTGASGFVGAFLLDRLLAGTDARVHCPVRARDAAHARRRVRANLERYGLDPAIAGDRVVCFPGDIAAPGLGLAEHHWAELSDTLDLVVHAAAHVNFLYPYRALRPANVDSVREIVRLAAPRRVPVHFLSTIAVIAGFGTAGVRHVPEDLPLDHADHLTMGYAESKWVAERVLLDAADQGLPVAVYRPYEITGDARNGACNTETAICSLFKTVADTGLAPDIALPMDFVPVDHLAAAVVHIATSSRAGNSVYHLTNPEPARFADMLDRMRAAGCEIATLPYADWVAELVRHVAGNPTSPTAPFVSLCVDRSNKSEISVKEMYFEEHFPAIGRSNVERALADSGLDCPPVDAALLDRYLEYFFGIGYLTRPEAAPAARR